MDIIKEISSIVNNDNDTESITNSLYDLKVKYKENGKKQLIQLVINIINCRLPINIDDDIQPYKMILIKEKEIEELKKIISNSTNIFLNALSSEIIWNKTKDYEMLVKAINSFIELLKYKKIDFDDRVKIIIRIYVLLNYIHNNISINKKEIETMCLNIVEENKSDDFLACFALKAISTGENCDYNRIIDDFEHKIIEFKKLKKFYLVEGYIDELINVYKKSKKSVDNLQIRKAKCYEDEANLLNWNDSQNSMQIVNLIQSAMNIWSNIPKNKNSKSERERLAKIIEPVKHKINENMRSLESPIDITKLINKINNDMKELSLEESIRYLATYPALYCVDNIKDITIDENSNFITIRLCGVKAIDKNGRAKVCIEPFNENNEEILFKYMINNAKEKYLIFSEFLNNIVLNINKKYKIDEESLSFIFDNSLLVDEKRKKAFTKGLLAGLRLDYITSISILMPQIENAIRELAQECGAVTYKTNPDGTEEALSLENIIKRPEFIDCIDPDLLFNMQVVFGSEFGFNMRNENAHGLLDDDEYNSTISLFTWWFILKLCYIYSSNVFDEKTRKLIAKA